LNTQDNVVSSFLNTRDSRIGHILGNVIDAESGESLPYVNLVLQGTDLGSASDLKGQFILSDVPAGKYNLIATYIGYKETILKDIIIQEGNTAEITISMFPSFLISDAVVITASRKAQTVVMAPASIGLVSEKQLTEKNISTFDQAFQDIPGVQITRSSGANVQAFSIRGASEVAGGGIGNRVLLLIDGRPALSPESGGALWNLVPMNSIERIEVVKGAYSSLFGSNAMGGVVNVITKTPTTEPWMKFHVNYGIYNKAPSYTGYSEFNDFGRADMSYGRTMGKISFLTDFGYKSNDGHKENASFQQYNAYGKVKYNFSNNRNILLSANYNSIRNDSPATWISRKLAYTVGEHKKDDIQYRKEYNTDLHYYALTKSNLKYSSRFFYYLNDSDYIFNGDPDNDSTNVNMFKQSVDEESIYARRLGNVTQVDFTLGSKHYMIAGADVKFDKVIGLPDTILYGTHSAFSFGTYVQDEISFSDKFIATIGMRYDLYDIKKEFRQPNFSPKIAMVYKVHDNFSIRSLFAQAFRDPSISERYIKFAQGSGLRFIPNPDLEAEKLLLSAELGTQFRILDKISVDIAGFYNNYNNLISFQQAPNAGGAWEVINLKKAVLQGAEISVKYKYKDLLDLYAGYTYLDAKDISEERFNDELAYKIKHSFSFSTNLKYKNFTLNFNGRYNDKVKEVFLYPGSEPTAYSLLNTKLSYTFKDYYSIYFALDNINDTQYEELERYRMPGRSFTIGGYVNM
jgi:outer membrane receptor for ferrienterochelin and colicin